MYYKRCTGAILVQKSTEMPEWVQWTHHSEGKTHCEECLMLDGCWFAGDAPRLVHTIHFAIARQSQLTMCLSQQMQQPTAITANLIHICSTQPVFIRTLMTLRPRCRELHVVCDDIFITIKCYLSLIFLLFLFKANPLHWASIYFWFSFVQLDASKVGI